MLFFLDPDLENVASDDELLGLDSLLQSAFYGCHIVLAHRNTADFVIDKFEGQISQQSIAYLKNLLSRYSQIGGLKSAFNTSVVVKRSPTPVSHNGNGEWTVPIEIFRNDEFSSKTVLLAENLVDCKIYKLAAELWSTHSRLLGLINIDLELRMGGGGTTYTVLESILQNENRICLTIVDSDKPGPNSRAGSTARSCDNEYRRCSAGSVCLLHTLEEREIENVLPISLVAASYEPADFDPSTIFAVTQDTATQPCHKYIDLKSGTCVGWIRETFADGSPDRVFWENAINRMESTHRLSARDNDDGACANTCENKSVCQWLISTGYPKDALTRILNIPLSDHKKLDLISNDYNFNSWLELGRLVFEWSAAAKPLRS